MLPAVVPERIDATTARTNFESAGPDDVGSPTVASKLNTPAASKEQSWELYFSPQIQVQGVP